MDFQLSQEQILLQDTARKFAQNELLELAKQVEIDDEPPGIEIRQRFAELGFLGANVDTRYGGAGMSTLTPYWYLKNWPRPP